LTLTVPSAPYGSSFIVRVWGGELIISWLDPRRKGQQRWAARQLVDIRLQLDSSGDGPVSHLVEIHPHPGEGKKVALPIWEEADARWLAATLREALHIPEPPLPGRLPPFLERDEQPAGSTIALERSAKGVFLAVPASGLWHPKVRWLFLAGVGVFALALLGGGFFYGLAELTAEPSLPDVFFPVMFRVAAAVWLVAFVLNGLLYFVDGFWRGRRHGLLGVAGDTLILRYTTLLGTRYRTWQRQSVADVRSGRTWGELEDANCELQVYLSDGKVIRLLAGYGDQELQWLATVLRRALRVPQAASTEEGSSDARSGSVRGPSARPLDLHQPSSPSSTSIWSGG
jgi:hypothetical protein